MNTELVNALQAKANVLRIHSIRATSAAGSGHPTTCLSCAEIVATLFFHVMRYDPKNPQHPLNDRFVLSKGHAAPILYAAWAEAGLFPVEKLLTLRRIDSDLEGHPTPRLPFVDVATGSLGQGLGAGVGLALNSKYLDKTGYRTYVLLGDGEVAEGAVWEAAELASYYKLDNLVAIVDVNRLGQSQATMLEHRLDVYKARFEAFGWNAVTVEGHSVSELLNAFELAKSSSEKPFAIIAKTLKGKGVSFAEDKDGWHGKPFKKGEEEQQAIADIEKCGIVGGENLAPPSPIVAELPKFEKKPMEKPAYRVGDMVATREAYGEALVRLGAADSRVVVLDGDTKNSTYSEKFLKAYPDRFFEGFIAEQNVISMATGLAARGKIVFASSFAVFLSRGFDQVRMAGISQSNLNLCGSHVGVSIGEDGPSQMGLEDLALFRAIPNSVVFYPSDAVATENAVALAAEYNGIAYIRTSRPKTPVIYANDEKFEIGKAKLVRKSTQDQITIVTGGVTLFEALKAADALQKDGISVRIVDLFTVKPVDRETLLECAQATKKLILTVEDHYPEGGIGEAVMAALADTDIKVVSLAVRELPRSGKPEELLARYGIDAAAIERRVRELVQG
ncbi:MAG: transketolase [Candidatus Hydrogenedentota bacterium]|jgi:transketolase|uniref:Transketolase n=1 Tax=Sumerlaea chitinivorans TaxID=2250252 RepID=A0A2Z4Y3T3_SUMC1|nr:Transketolase [Candidatus Sumerlaea chitinivorans]RMH25179.1 MAG: transketolase [Candidatus Hydrogenedentota bacterium]GIX44241.1 MAG: transketolase [Candidatus Sumerlaea sp.]